MMRFVMLMLTAACISLPASAQTPSAAPWPCRSQLVESCFKRHGRLSSQNGIALTIWLIGTTRVVGLANDVDELPVQIRKYLDMTSPDHSYIYGDFDLCPVEPDKSGYMRRVCVAGAEKLVIQNLQGSRPPFRLRSTWPAALFRPRESSWPLVDARCGRTRGGGQT
jgi:hypothetical protein